MDLGPSCVGFGLNQNSEGMINCGVTERMGLDRFEQKIRTHKATSMYVGCGFNDGDNDNTKSVNH